MLAELFLLLAECAVLVWLNGCFWLTCCYSVDCVAVTLAPLLLCWLCFEHVADLLLAFRARVFWLHCCLCGCVALMLAVCSAVRLAELLSFLAVLLLFESSCCYAYRCAAELCPHPSLSTEINVLRDSTASKTEPTFSQSLCEPTSESPPYSQRFCKPSSQNPMDPASWH